MNYAAPAEQDQPTVLDSALEAAGVPRSLSPELLQFARRADLRLDGSDVDDEDNPDDTAPDDADQPGDEEEESFTDSFNPDDLPDEAREAYTTAYKRLQADYTKKRQADSEGRREAERNEQIVRALNSPNPQLRAAVLSQLGIDLVDDNEPDDDDDDPDLYDEIEGLKAWKTEQEQATQASQQEEAVLEYVSDEIAALEKKEDREFDAEEHQLLDTFARQNPTPEGYPDVEGAYNLLSGIVKSRSKANLESRKKTPRRPGQGTPASRRVDPSKESREERLARMADAIDEHNASQAA